MNPVHTCGRAILIGMCLCSVAAAQALPTYQICVVDGQKKPISEIQVEDASPYSGSGDIAFEIATTTLGSKPRAMKSADGTYQITRSQGYDGMWGLWVSAQGTARELLVYSKMSAGKPQTVVLRPGAKITIFVGKDGRPLKDATVMLAGRAGQFAFGGPKTDADGKCVLDRLPPGRYVYTFAEPTTAGKPYWGPKYAPNLEFKLEAGKEYRGAVDLLPPAGLAEALLKDWYDAFPHLGEPQNKPAIGKNVPALGAAQRKGLISLIQTRLSQLPGPTRDARICATAAEHFKLPETVDSLKTILQAPCGTHEAHAAAHAIAVLAGDKAVNFFVSSAQNSECVYQARAASVVALGQIGSKKSLAAFKKLLDQARAQQSAVAAPATDAEQMAETADLVFNVIPKQGSKQVVYPLRIFKQMTKLNDQATTGVMMFGRGGDVFSRILMRKIEETWVISGYDDVI